MRDVYLAEKFQSLRKAKTGTRFSQVYEEAADAIFEVTSATALRLLFWILNEMDADNLVRLRGIEKERFAEKCNQKYPSSTINKALKVLQEQGFIVSINRGGERTGSFFVNPHLFWKSNSQKDRNKRIHEFHEFLKLKSNEEN